MEDGLNHHFAKALRLTTQVLHAHQQLLEAVYQSHLALIGALRGGDLGSSESTVFDLKAIEQARAEVAKLEDLLDLSAPDVEQPEPPISEPGSESATSFN